MSSLGILERPSSGNPSAKTMSRIGHIESFDDTTSDWRSYEERLASYLLVNEVPEGKKVHAFLSLIGPKTYALLKSLTAPQSPSEKSFTALLKLLGDHLAPQPSVIAERAKFYKRSQEESESIAEFVAVLRDLAQSCDFGGFLDEALRDRFVCGLRREDVQRVLFTEDKKLTFQKAVERALAMEIATKSAALTHTSGASVPDVHKVRVDHKARIDKQVPEQSSCFRCGSTNHRSDACPHVGDTCFKCNRKGHIQRACRSGNKKPTKSKRQRQVKTLTSVHDAVSLQAVKAAGLEPITVPINVDGVKLTMELDTGAAVSVVSLAEFRKLFPRKQLQPTTLTLARIQETL